MASAVRGTPGSVFRPGVGRSFAVRSPSALHPDPGGLFPPRLFPQVVCRLPDGRRRLLRRGRLREGRRPGTGARRGSLRPQGDGIAPGFVAGPQGVAHRALQGVHPVRRSLRPGGRRGVGGSRGTTGRGAARTPALPPGEGVRGARPVGRPGGVSGRTVGEPGRGIGAGRGGGRPPAVLDRRRLEPRRVDVVGRSVAAGRPPADRGADAKGARAGRRVRRRRDPRIFRRLRGGASRGDGWIDRAGAASYGAGDGAVRGKEGLPARHLRRDGVGPDPGPEGVPGPPRPRARLRRAVGGPGVPDGEPRVPAPRGLDEREGG